MNAGDTIEVQWDSSTHPGPITHFLYGPVSDATQATGIGKWVKINEFDEQSGEWANQIMEAQNMTYSFKLPTNLATGDYLLRGEMEALHASEEVNGAQFYIGCAQIHITGNNGGTCSPSIQLPGAYHSMDTDIYISNFYNGFDISTFTAPGGPVATCGGSGGGFAPVTTTKSTPAATPTFSTSVIKTTNHAVTSTAPGTTTPTTGGTVAKYGQCGGSGYAGPTQCVAGTSCTAQNSYYSQCL